MIDWTKPIITSSGLDARVERVLPNGEAIVSWQDRYVNIFDPETSRLHNFPPKPRPGARAPREWWVVFAQCEPTQVWHRPPDTEASKFNRTFVHVREVLPE